MKKLSVIQIAFLTALVLGSSCDAATPKRNIGETFERLHAEVAEMSKAEDGDASEVQEPATSETSKSGLQIATFGNGCFWCTEAVFEELVGVHEVVSGYSGGLTKNPTYKAVCTGLTGHAEVIHLRFDPAKISYAKLLEAFWRTHDPTTLNRQGPDVGTQYRSVVFYHNEEQKKQAQLFKSELNKDRSFRKPVVTQIAKFEKFYPAERYHQDYFELNGRAPYCRQAIAPKISKFRRIFKDELKRNPKNRPEKAGAK